MANFQIKSLHAKTKKSSKETERRINDHQILKKFGYTLGREIGSGTFAKVRLAEWTRAKEKTLLAVKIVDTKLAPKEITENFLPRELSIWPSLYHSNIIQVYSIITISKRKYIFMELAENGDIIEYLQTYGAVEESLTRKWIGQLVCALKFCHRKGIAHRDVKCENLLLDKDYDLKLTDFGFSKICVNRSTHRRILSETYCGSAAYAAPEVLRGSPYNPLLSDAWSVGICLYVMLNNIMPFNDSNLITLYKDQINRRWRFTSNVEPFLSTQVKFLIRRLLEPNVFKRCNIETLSHSPWLNHSC